MEENKKIKTVGRPKSKKAEEETVNETSQDRLDMEKLISIDEITEKWKKTFNGIAQLNGTEGIGTVADKWNKLNPFLQNQRIKNIYTNAKKYDKTNISRFLENPANSERELRSLSWANSSAQQIYYNILRRACDIPLYNYYKIPQFMEDSAGYKKPDFVNEDRFTDEWLEMFNVKNTFKTIALEVKREGKSTYLLRNKMEGAGKSLKPVFCTLQKLPTEWTKIVGKGQLGFLVSFDMMYFLDIANSPADFGDFMIQAWNDICEKGVVVENADTKKRELNLSVAKNYKFTYEGVTYKSSIEAVREGRQMNYMFWLRIPYDICFTFGSDNSNPWVAPDTMGLMLKLQELTDYGQLAGLIASTPLTAVLTGEIETIPQPRAGKNESVYTPEILKGWMEQFNEATSTNVEAWLWPAKNIKLQQLSSDVNSSDILSNATENFIESAGEGGLTITTSKPNVSQVKTAQLLAAAQQDYVTRQFEQVMNFIVQKKLGLKYDWKIKIWGDIFERESDIKILKEIVAGGNIALFPKLMSAEDISMRDTKAITEYLKTLDFYKDFMTYTQLKNSELQIEASEAAADLEGDDEETDEEETKGAGRPKLSDSDLTNEATAASRDSGTNTSDNRDS